jgi:hypothetical protein
LISRSTKKTTSNLPRTTLYSQKCTLHSSLHLQCRWKMQRHAHP